MIVFIDLALKGSFCYLHLGFGKVDIDVLISIKDDIDINICMILNKIDQIIFFKSNSILKI